MSDFVGAHLSVAILSVNRWRLGVSKIADSEILTPVWFYCSAEIFSVSITVFMLLTTLFERGICNMVPKIRVLGCHAPKFVKLSTRPSKDTSSRQNTRFESSTMKIDLFVSLSSFSDRGANDKAGGAQSSHAKGMWGRVQGGVRPFLPRGYNHRKIFKIKHRKSCSFMHSGLHKYGLLTY
jgi:hypothetical protein